MKTKISKTQVFKPRNYLNFPNFHHQHSLEDFWEVSQVESVVRFGWCREQLGGDLVINLHCRVNDIRTKSFDLIGSRHYNHINLLVKTNKQPFIVLDGTCSFTCQGIATRRQQSSPFVCMFYPAHLRDESLYFKIETEETSLTQHCWPELLRINNH